MSEEQSDRVLPNLGTIKPQEAVAYALLMAFLLFLSLDLLQAAITNDYAFTVPRIVSFVRGFVATAAGMLFVWVTMHRKEQELIRLRDHFSYKADRATSQTESLLQDFLAVINHRMRTPIRANARAATLMVQESFGVVTQQQVQLLQHLIENNAEVDRLLGTLIDIYDCKTGSKRLSFQRCDLGELARQCVDAGRFKSRTQGADVDLELEPAPVDADCEEVGKLICHLLDNAAKFASSRVQVKSGIKPSGIAFVAVTDDGKGMPPEDVKNLFERFYQMSSEGKYAASTGVGLCLCAEIVKAHGGTIKCDSKVNNGTTFTVEMPVSQAF